jgi:hypothetical protein
MRKLLGVVALAGLAVGSASATLIDNFSDFQATVEATSATGSLCSGNVGAQAPTSVGPDQCGFSSLGITTGYGAATRGMFIDYNGGGDPGADDTRGTVTGSGRFVNSRGVGVLGDAEMQYILAVPVTFSSLLNAFVLDLISTDGIGGELYFYVQRSSDSMAFFSPAIAIPNTPGSLISFFSSWSLLPSGTDTIDRLGFVVNGDTASDRDYSFDNFATTVPEAGSYVLMGLGLAAIGLLRRKR